MALASACSLPSARLESEKRNGRLRNIISWRLVYMPCIDYDTTLVRPKGFGGHCKKSAQHGLPPKIYSGWVTHRARPPGPLFLPLNDVGRKFSEYVIPKKFLSIG